MIKNVGQSWGCGSRPENQPWLVVFRYLKAFLQKGEYILFVSEGETSFGV